MFTWKLSTFVKRPNGKTATAQALGILKKYLLMFRIWTRKPPSTVERFFSRYVGGTSKHLESLFKEAPLLRAYARCRMDAIIVFDEGRRYFVRISYVTQHRSTNQPFVSKTTSWSIGFIVWRSSQVLLKGVNTWGIVIPVPHDLVQINLTLFNSLKFLVHFPNTEFEMCFVFVISFGQWDSAFEMCWLSLRVLRVFFQIFSLLVVGQIFDFT